MGNPRPDDWLEVTLARMEATELRHSNERRVQINDLAAKLDLHVVEDHSVEKRVTALEAESTRIKEASKKTAALQSAGIPALLIASWEILKRTLLGWK